MLKKQFSMKYIVNSSQILHSIAIKQEERRVEISGKIFLMILGNFFHTTK